jgi:hypothetical protein
LYVAPSIAVALPVDAAVVVAEGALDAIAVEVVAAEPLDAGFALAVVVVAAPPSFPAVVVPPV